ncbi:hypothetical protein D3C78_1374940 [compost metagenome]
MTNLHAAANAVVVVVVGTWDQLRRAGTATGKLEERYLIGRGWRSHEIAAILFQPARQRLLTLFLTAQSDQAQ